MNQPSKLESLIKEFQSLAKITGISESYVISAEPNGKYILSLECYTGTWPHNHTFKFNSFSEMLNSFANIIDLTKSLFNET